MIVPIKCMPKISAVGLFCLDKFENNQTRTCTTFFRTSKLAEVYFRGIRTDAKIRLLTKIDFNVMHLVNQRKKITSYVSTVSDVKVNFS